MKIDIKNNARYYFGHIIRLIGINPGDFSLDRKHYENILIYDILYKILTGSIPLRIRFDKIGGFIKTYAGIWYLALFGGGFYNRIKYFITKNSYITDTISQNFASIRTQSYNYNISWQHKT